MIVKDLDDFYIKSRNLREIIKNINKLINKFCKKYYENIIIFVGSNCISSNKDFSNQIYYKIDAKYRYFINVKTDIVLKKTF